MVPLDKRDYPFDYTKDCELINCPSCKQDQYEYITTRVDGFKVVKCSACKLLYLNPAPKDIQLANFYENYSTSYVGGRDTSIQKNRSKYSNISDEYRLKTLSKFIEIKDIFVSDIGCGMGHMLFLLKKAGATVLGFEFDKFARDYCKEELKLNVIDQDFLSYENTNGMDVIIFDDFIEHPRLVFNFVRKAHQLLKTNGFLLIWTPHGELNGYFKDTFLKVDLEHLQYFNPESIKNIAHKNGFEVVHCETLGHPSLEGIVPDVGLKAEAKRLLKKIARPILFSRPFIRLMNLKSYYYSNEVHDYHLFAILKKTS